MDVTASLAAACLIADAGLVRMKRRRDHGFAWYGQADAKTYIARRIVSAATINLTNGAPLSTWIAAVNSRRAAGATRGSPAALVGGARGRRPARCTSTLTGVVTCGHA